eukprot:scaffold7157_cov66-Attheya_sp.AAC.1
MKTDIPADEARRAHLPSLDETNMGDDDIGLFIGPWGPYIQKKTKGEETVVTAPLPTGMAADLSTVTIEALRVILSSKEQDGVLMGNHPDDGRPIRLKVGRYGAYLQWGDSTDKTVEDDSSDDDAPPKKKTSNHSLPKHLSSMRNLDLDAPVNETVSALGEMLGLSFEHAI